ncbi:MAG: ABC transporter ATP-binding protein [Bacillota bacterium]|nr:ABC transporter ATP-binding protein [Bacillota bacterium]
MNVIEIKNLTKSYGKSRGIENISLSVEEGEIFGFIGPNGAGKSTTIRTLLSLIYPTSGSATIFGKDCIKYASDIAKDIGYLPSEVFYYDNMRVRDLLKYAASFYKKDCKARINELCDRLELDQSKKIEDLSFGNRKKVGIVQGLLHEPKLIILDEPTSGLDPLMQKTFFNLLKEENEKGATILFSSHILSEVQRMCNKVAIIKEGHIVKIENMNELKENSYKKVFIELPSQVDKSFFSLEGISKLSVENDTVSFIYKGNVNPLVQKLASLNMRNISIDEPDLEEIFMHYYN